MMNRRDFLRAVAIGGGAFLASDLFGRRTHASEASRRFPPGTWGGNRPGFGHDIIREEVFLPRLKPARSVDFCIVGGGLAGLSAAWRLRDESFVLIEHMERLGGHAQRDQWEGIWYSGGAAYLVEPEPPLDGIYAELALPLRKIHEPADSAILSWNHVVDTFGEGLAKLPYPKQVREDFARARRDFEAILAGDDCPVMPLSETSEESRKLDRMTFADWMLREKRYHPALKAYVDLYCRSAFGAPSSRHVSAFAGLNFYVSEFAPRYSFPGGTAVAAEILRERIEAAGTKRIQAGATVVSVENGERGAIVTLIDGEGRAEAIEARVVLFAAPKLVAARTVRGLPGAQAKAMAGLSYGSYVVANVLCKEPVTESSFDTWTDSAPFTDIVVADWVTRKPGAKPGAGKKGEVGARRQQVLTVYYPVGYDHQSILSDDSYDGFRDRVVEHLDLLYPGAERKIEDVRLNRWGHALCHARPGWYVEQSVQASAPFGRVLFAHSDNQGLPAFEAALVEGTSAAAQAKALLAS